jgi:cobyric acid synthase CobQ/L-threonine-O-3-phosphate decarboxylase
MDAAGVFTAMSESVWPHGGNLRLLAETAGIAESDILDFSANINPLGPADWLRPLVSATVSGLCHYPDPACTKLLSAAASRYGIAADELVAGNGSSELLYAVLPLLHAARAIIPVPSYRDYAEAARRAGLAVELLPLDPVTSFALDIDAVERELDASPARAVVLLGYPNNPTGGTFDAKRLRRLAAARPRAWFVVDEAFADFVDGLDRFAARRPSNVIVLLSATKNYAVPGLRLGLLAAAPELAQGLRMALPPWTVNTIAQAVGEAAFRDAEYLKHAREKVRQWREQLEAGLRAIPGVHVYSSKANFILARLEQSGMDARTLASRLLQRGIAIRVCGNFDGLDGRYFRVAVRTEAENATLLAAMAGELAEAPAIVKHRSTPALMFQGTCSNAGKSVLTAAFCRILLQDGFRVAPFKAQNMSLNSYVTQDGLEMGRAQVVQAQACRLDPDVRMNPILLKPNSETGSQIILRGQPIGNMDAIDYFRYKAHAWEQVKNCYDSLAAESDAIVLEGAGSPAEVNLKRYDIVNMAMAFHADAPVVLIGDIDRGGVFAALIGCMEVFTEHERAQVVGFLLNRFRGKRELLGDAADYVLRHTGKPILAVVPFLRDLGLPEEDSVGFKEGVFDDLSETGDRVEIAIIDLPHISNFTDFDALRIEPDVHLRRVNSVADLGHPDAVILPGSKNVPGDLCFLRECGLADALIALARSGRCETVGICGGFQMLGTRVEDPHNLESSGETHAALSLLPLVTTLEPDKTLRRVVGRHIESGLDIAGYEIHHGQTTGSGVAPLIRNDTGEFGGGRSADGRIWGTYLHGIFDRDEFRRWFIDRLRTPRLEPKGRVLAHYDLEPALERLAETVREALPIETLYRRMGLR